MLPSPNGEAFGANCFCLLCVISIRQNILQLSLTQQQLFHSSLKFKVLGVIKAFRIL